eukprot:CAMPEP_0202451112 /NCGR_PEP_ID=MMETSP1360-20130828/9610_1 /ASSEMBLY_ACC=CAM_ASM_000848 /TAXON_ID=515479 /ORGANISM="Licmophora paradoxa, Strain CCMP2313" /LENGTH=42 /DNA_ID= /DNA_START= /DNA_END= /DNA_ORIENTATION=
MQKGAKSFPPAAPDVVGAAAGLWAGAEGVEAEHVAADPSLQR